MFCGKCGSRVDNDSSFCSSCGAPIAGSAGYYAPQYIQQVPQPVPVIIQAPPRKTNGEGVAGLVIGIVGGFICWVPYVGLLIEGLACVLCIIGLTNKNCGKGPAIVGLILSIIGVLFAFFYMMIFVEIFQ